MYVLMISLAVLTVGPFVYLLLGSLVKGNLLTLFRTGEWLDPARYTLQNYLGPDGVWATFSRMRLFENTVLICAVGVTLELFVSALAAYPLARMAFPGRGLVFALMLSTMMLPAQATMIVNFNTIRFLGLYDTYAAVILPSAASVFGIFLMRQAFITVPKELDEAARIDGAGDFTIWWRIMLPLTRPALGTLAIFSFVGYWNSFIWPLVVLKHENKYPLAVGLQFMAEVFDKTFGKIAAGSILSVIPIIAVFLLLQKQFIRGITAGAVK